MGIIKTREEIKHIADQKRSQGKTIVTTNGAFDILHAGHVAYLQEARKLGDVLIVGLNSDASVKRLKGEKRPLNNQNDRATVLAALGCVDYVVIFDEDTPNALLSKIKPNIHVKAGDYCLDPNAEPSRKIHEQETIEKNGGKVVLLPFVEGRSTTNLIERIVELYRHEEKFKHCKQQQ